MFFSLQSSQHPQESLILRLVSGSSGPGQCLSPTILSRSRHMELQGCTEPRDSCLPAHQSGGGAGLGLRLLRAHPTTRSQREPVVLAHVPSPTPQKGVLLRDGEHFSDAESME